MAITKWPIPDVMAITKWSIQGSARRWQTAASTKGNDSSANSQVFLRPRWFNPHQPQAW
jgi:hypothetical protein